MDQHYLKTNKSKKQISPRSHQVIKGSQGFILRVLQVCTMMHVLFPWTLAFFAAEQQRERKRWDVLDNGAEGRGGERTENKIPSVLAWIAHFVAWRD